MPDLDFSAEANNIWTQMGSLLSDSVSANTQEQTMQIMYQLNELIGQAIQDIKQESEIYNQVSSYQFFKKSINENELSTIIMQNQQKSFREYTSLQSAYMFLDKAYEIITGNKTEFVITATGEEEFFAKTYSLEEILMRTHTIKQGNFILQSTMSQLKNEIQQEKNRIALEGNTLKVYQTFYSLARNKKAKGFTEGHLSEAIQRYLSDVREGKKITEETLLSNITDSLQNAAFYEEGDLSRDSGDLMTTIETQLKNISLNKKYNFITIGNIRTIINALLKLQNIIQSSAALSGSEIKQQLQKEMFSHKEAPRKINESLKKEATREIQELLKKFNSGP